MVAQVGGLMSAETDTLSQLLRLAKFSRVFKFLQGCEATVRSIAAPVLIL